MKPLQATGEAGAVRRLCSARGRPVKAHLLRVCVPLNPHLPPAAGARIQPRKSQPPPQQALTSKGGCGPPGASQVHGRREVKGLGWELSLEVLRERGGARSVGRGTACLRVLGLCEDPCPGLRSWREGPGARGAGKEKAGVPTLPQIPHGGACLSSPPGAPTWRTQWVSRATEAVVIWPNSHRTLRPVPLGRWGRGFGPVRAHIPGFHPA